MYAELLAIPLVTALVGWSTNAMAIRMLFAPVEWMGWWKIGWQGVLPANAERMATICVRLMTSKLLDIEEIFARIEPERVSALLSPALERNAEEIVERVLQERFPTVWESLPERLRQNARARLHSEVPQVVQRLMQEVGDDLRRYLDIEAMVIKAFVKNRALLNELFQECGRQEFHFISRSGLYFGALFGIVQAAVWWFIQPLWFLPLTGLLVGWATNWIALKMVFEPQQARSFGPLTWQGLFLMRQKEVSAAYASFFAERILHPEALVDTVVQGPASERIIELLQRYVEQAVDQASGIAKPLLQLTVGTDEWRSLKQEISNRLTLTVPSELDRVYDYTAEAIEIEKELQKNLENLSPDQFEEVLRPLFRQDENTLIAVGAVLGGIAGCIQWVLVTAG